MNNSRNIVLTGFMGTGKTTLGRLIAQRLQWEFLDTDEEIERRANMPIPRIFESYGETHFRALEKDLCKELASRTKLVVATGGGMPSDPENRRLLTAGGTVIRLSCSPEAILARVNSGEGRPMLGEGNIDKRIADLLDEREPAYLSFPFQVDTTSLSVEQAEERVMGLVDSAAAYSRFLSVSVPMSAGYTIALGPGMLDLLGEMLRDRNLTSRVAVVTDSHVAPLYLDRVMSSLTDSGFRPFAITVPAGEESKNLRQLGEIYTALLKAGMDRRGAVVALGGGVVGDLAGFAAATYMRGVSLVQCPTTLLAMVDSSVGGKTGVDLPQGKNLVGAVKQPALVAADTIALGSLPRSQIRMGMAELIKHTIIDDAVLFAELETSGGTIELGPEMVARSVRVKIHVVEGDPFESGRRA
ncbi:MAG: bifunctional shikimate kinase/3-dehydroquinate synthase, partial [Desulfomonilaceae bacterium]|nr:bifunctional shikimate kinase/3-dehydroquinate synthase [Desulfomonilaceae bacterium]